MFNQILDRVQNKWIVSIIITSAIFLGLAIYIYIYHISPKLNPDFIPNREFVKDTNKGDGAKLYLFYTNWCPHSKKALPIFQTIKKKYENEPVNDTLVTFYEINGETDESELTSFETLHNVKVDGYPSIYLIKGEQVIEYDAETTEETLSEFLHTTL
tara:strand:+ start:5477 stop:5947 length:471 start_codon:yes stop_codon:yes gene_type:complete